MSINNDNPSLSKQGRALSLNLRPHTCDLSFKNNTKARSNNYPHFAQSPVMHSVHPPIRMSLFWAHWERQWTCVTRFIWIENSAFLLSLFSYTPPTEDNESSNTPQSRLLTDRYILGALVPIYVPDSTSPKTLQSSNTPFNAAGCLDLLSTCFVGSLLTSILISRHTLIPNFLRLHIYAAKQTVGCVGE